MAAAAAAAAAMANYPDVAAVLQVCNATPAHILALTTDEGYQSLSDFADDTPEDFAKLAKDMASRRAAEGRLRLPHKVIKNIQALCFWATELTRKNKPLVAADFDQETLIRVKQERMMRTETKADPPSIKPAKLDINKWADWSMQFRTYLSSIKGSQLAPVDYIIRQDPSPLPLADLPQTERDRYDYPLTGPHFKEDNTMVFGLLSDLVYDTPGWVYIQEHHRQQDGRAAWLSLFNHFEGGNQKEKRMIAAENQLKNLHYRNESVFSWEQFSSKLIQIYNELDGTPKERNEHTKVDELLERIIIPNNGAVEVIKEAVRANHQQDL